MGIGNLPIHDGIFDAIFYCADERAGGDIKNINDLFSADWIFLVTELVFFFGLLNSFFSILIVTKILLASLLILTGDIRLSERHQILQFISCFIDDPSYGVVTYLFISQRDGPQMEANQLLHIPHSLIERQGESPEYPGYPFSPERIVPVESPS